jgi:hypothetical protein
MDATFPMQTGAISYTVNLAAPAATGSWSVSLGFLDIKPNVWSISGASGKIYDNSGYMVGSYNADIPTYLQGVINGSGHTLYQDSVLLSNTETQDSSDYNQVSINGNYVGGYLPTVGIGGEAVFDEFSNLTVPFWSKVGDDRLLFVTENAQADRGFIQAVSGMGFTVDTGALTGAAGAQGVDFGRPYGLIVFGSATSSGVYHSGRWNDLNIPMMSLNSHLVTPENLNWYGGRPSTLTLADQTGGVYPQRYKSTQGRYSIWAQFPVQGWEQLVYSPEAAAGYGPEYSFFFPLGRTGVLGEGTNATGNFVLFTEAGTAPSDYTQVFMREQQTTGAPFDYQYTATSIVSGHISPTGYDGVLQQDYEVTFSHLYPSYTYVDTYTGVTVKISNYFGGTGAPPFSLTGSPWAKNQIYNMGRVVPQTASYNVDNLYRRTTLTSGLYPADQFDMYTGSVYSSNSCGGNALVTNLNSGNLITVWHRGFWTGQLVADQSVAYSLGGGFTEPELMVFSVTSTGMEWTGGYDMWSTLTTTGKQLFVNAVAGFFID